MQPDFDVFLSHHHDDTAVVEKVARKLEKKGICVWLDIWHLVPGRPWQEDIELTRCATCAVFVGRSGAAAWQKVEMRVAIDRQIRDASRRFRVIPVLLPGADQGLLPPFLVTTTWVKFDTDNDPKALHRLISGIRGLPPRPKELHGGATAFVLVILGSQADVLSQREKILTTLRKLSGDSALSIQEIALGSILIFFHASRAGSEQIEFLVRTGQLTTLEGFAVSQFREVLENEHASASVGSRPRVLFRRALEIVSRSAGSTADRFDRAQESLKQYFQSMPRVSIPKATLGLAIGCLALVAIKKYYFELYRRAVKKVLAIKAQESAGVALWLIVLAVLVGFFLFFLNQLRASAGRSEPFGGRDQTAGRTYDSQRRLFAALLSILLFVGFSLASFAGTLYWRFLLVAREWRPGLALLGVT